jgi:hypothetical protein
MGGRRSLYEYLKHMHAYRVFYDCPAARAQCRGSAARMIFLSSKIGAASDRREVHPTPRDS